MWIGWVVCIILILSVDSKRAKRSYKGIDELSVRFFENNRNEALLTIINNNGSTAIDDSDVEILANVYAVEQSLVLLGKSKPQLEEVSTFIFSKISNSYSNISTTVHSPDYFLLAPISDYCDSDLPVQIYLHYLWGQYFKNRGDQASSLFHMVRVSYLTSIEINPQCAGKSNKYEWNCKLWRVFISDAMVSLIRMQYFRAAEFLSDQLLDAHSCSVQNHASVASINEHFDTGMARTVTSMSCGHALKAMQSFVMTIQKIGVRVQNNRIATSVPPVLPSTAAEVLLDRACDIGKALWSEGAADAGLQWLLSALDKLGQSKRSVLYTLLESAVAGKMTKARKKTVKQVLKQEYSLDAVDWKIMERALEMLEGLGRRREARALLSMAHILDKNHKGVLQRLADQEIVIGDYIAAARHYYELQQVDETLFTDSLSFYPFVLALYLVRMEDKPMLTNSFDDVVPLWLRWGWSYKQPWRAVVTKQFMENTLLTLWTEAMRRSAPPRSKRFRAKPWLRIADTIGREWVQLNNNGFTPNQRLMRGFGFSAVEMAQYLAQMVQETSAHMWLNMTHELRQECSENTMDCTQTTAWKTLRKETLKGLRKASKTTMWTHWKSFTSIAVKWRQAAEPLDSVFWIDKAIDRSTPNKMCLYTHLWNRFNEPQRYVTYFNKAFELVKELVKTRGLWIPMDKFPSWLHGVWVNTTAGDAFETETSEPIVTLAQLATGLNTTIDALHSGIDRATTLFELYGVLGKIDAFSTYTWIESRIHSDATTMDHWLPGSRLTVTRSTQSLGSNTTYAEDMEIYICSPSHDDRVQRFSREIERQFEVLTDTLLAIEITQQSCLSRLGKHPKHYRKHTLRRSVVREVCGGEMDSVQLLRQQAVHQALHMLYYWVVLAPLTRGSSFTGYAVLLSTLLYLGEMPQVSWPRPFNPNDPAASKRLYFLPHNKQLDWEALLTPSPHEFVDNVLGKMIRWNSSHGFHENVTATTVVLPHIHGLYTVRERASLKRWTSALRGIKRTKKHRDISFYRSTLKNACVDPTAHACLWRKVPSRKDMNEALFGGPIVFDV